ncbi:hypothetical protein N864_08855 [Intrasporangium chromatireducens Q5-1]|uniref:DUF58 domain-containing protein n=1 Tax=Intrasporangium chromatireducens Q5-1 TaxID=584657 RepID=W9GLZ9_9MICO|nr:DUF58 domain-containing protein [Intrasporangium chromatireducens]EWT07286.1 hypothetical protein N864_08855 [Intrasporangium chromatireducens Q5-1]
MATTHLLRVKTALFVHARRPAHSLLEGEYASLFHGRSLDYDDLRGYVPGDEVRDIDWKATARHDAPLVKRYVATRKHHLLLVSDTGRGMAATTPSGEAKQDVAILAAGLVGYLAVRHGDVVGLVRGTAERTATHELRGTEGHLETLLQAIDDATAVTGDQSNPAAQLRWVVRHVRRRMLLLVLADDRDLGPEVEDLLRRLRVQHEVLWLTIEDADPTRIPAGVGAYDVADGYALPAEVRLDPRVQEAYAAERARRVEVTAALLARLGIAHGRLASSEAVVPAVLALLERQRRAR